MRFQGVICDRCGSSKGVEYAREHGWTLGGPDDFDLCGRCGDPRCPYTFPLPGWMGVDQADPCRCDLVRGHGGEHECEHTRKPAVTTAPANVGSFVAMPDTYRPAPLADSEPN